MTHTYARIHCICHKPSMRSLVVVCGCDTRSLSGVRYWGALAISLINRSVEAELVGRRRCHRVPREFASDINKKLK